MRLATVSIKDSKPVFAVQLRQKMLRVVEAARAFELSDADIELISSTQAYFDHLPKSEKVLRKLLQDITKSPKKIARPGSDNKPILVDLDAVTFLPPIARPGKILCIGLNYKDHCDEQNKPLPKFPVVFNKFATSLRGHEAEIPLPIKIDANVDYEAEFAVVIGKRATNVTKRSAMKYVGGYTMMNDVSLRSIQKSEPQWSRAKGWDGSAPMGPIIVTPDEIPDPHNLKITCTVNGEVRQNSNTGNLVFDIPALIQFITKLVTLEPGDIISTGTPGGVGAYREPQGFLKPGDVVEVKVDRIGVLKNTCGTR